MIRISLSADEKYCKVLTHCLTNLSLYANADVELDFISVGFDGSDFIKKYPRFNHFNLNPDQVRFKNQHNSPQYGDFIEAYPQSIKDRNDVVIFIDGDCIIQRPLNTQEIDKLNNYKDGDFGVNYNAGPRDSLFEEAIRLTPVIDGLALSRLWWPDGVVPSCFNTGVAVANINTWKSMADEFGKHWEKEKKCFIRPSAQWLMSWILMKVPDFNLDIIPLTFHTHGHFGLFPGITTDEEGLTSYKGEVCLFRHKIAWNQ